MAQTHAVTRLAPAAWVVLGIGALALVLVHAQVTMFGPDAERFTFDSAEYALAGRAWLETGRLVTPYAHPAVLASMPGPPFPLIAGHPLVPALDAIAFAILGAKPEATLAPTIARVRGVRAARSPAWRSGSPARARPRSAPAPGSPSPAGRSCYALEGRSEMPYAALLTAALVLLWDMPRATTAVLARRDAGPVATGAAGVRAAAAGAGARAVVPVRRARSACAACRWYSPAFCRSQYSPPSTSGPRSGTRSRTWAATCCSPASRPSVVVSRINRMTPPPDALAWVRANPGLYAHKILHNLRVMVYGTWTRAAAGRARSRCSPPGWRSLRATAPRACSPACSPARSRCSCCSARPPCPTSACCSRCSRRASRCRSPIIARLAQPFGTRGWPAVAWPPCSPWRAWRGAAGAPVAAQPASPTPRPWGSPPPNGAGSSGRWRHCCPRLARRERRRRRGSHGARAGRRRWCRWNRRRCLTGPGPAAPRRRWCSRTSGSLAAAGGRLACTAGARRSRRRAIWFAGRVRSGRMQAVVFTRSTAP